MVHEGMHIKTNQMRTSSKIYYLILGRRLNLQHREGSICNTQRHTNNPLGFWVGTGGWGQWGGGLGELGGLGRGLCSHAFFLCY